MLITVRERIIQSIAFELIGLFLVLPLFSIYTNSSQLTSFWILCLLSVSVMLWSAAHNTIFDLLEWQLFARVASDRTNRLRAVHAVSLELTSMLLTVPLLVCLLDMSWSEALVLDIAMTIIYIVYSYLFHRAFDFLRPVNIDT